MQSAKASPQPPKRSDPVKPKPPDPVKPKPPVLRFQWEPFSLVFKEVAPLTVLNYAEAGTFRDQLPFDADWQRYFQFEDAGMLSVLTARIKGELVGYVACLVLPFLQHRTELCCTVNSIWLHEKHRRGMVGIRMLKRAIGDLQGKGVRIFQIAAKQEQFGNILKRLGFLVEETVYMKLVDK